MRVSTKRKSPSRVAPATPVQSDPMPSTLRHRVFAGLFGAFLGLSMLKFGNPPITEKWVTIPSNIYEFLLGYPWPIDWAMGLLGVISVIGLFLADWKGKAPRSLLALPLIWFGWQLLSATQTVDADLTHATLKHFAACVICFYLGYFVLGYAQQLGSFWLGLICGLCLVLVVGWEQRFGGLEETRRYFFLYIYPGMKEVPPEYLKKMSSNRIFSTLFYPNALAGVLLLLLPLTLGLIHSADRYLTKPARGFLQFLMCIFALGCLYWSQSKGGWLLMVLLGILTLMRLPLGKRFKLVLATGVLLLSLGGFFWKYSGFFKKGATSVSARMDYWQAAWRTARSHPVFGTGPGTFYIPYMAIKRPESESARLVHNDYLEQASDSGLLGFLAYSAFIVYGLIWTSKQFQKVSQIEVSSMPGTPRVPPLTPGRLEKATGSKRQQDWLFFGIWLGLLGWALQGLIEFGLYIPGSAWPAFSLFGWMIQRSSQHDPSHDS
jgi:O-antigen ligase